MYDASHIAIAEQIILELKPKFPRANKYKKALRNGSIYPNKQDLETPHHHYRDREIKELIEQARKLKLENNNEKAIFTLGIALHYIQDRWTSLPESNEKHNMYEKLITQCTIHPLGTDLSKYYPILSEGVFETFESDFSFFDNPPQAEKVIEMVLQQKPSESSAFLDLNLAYRISFMVTKIVLQPVKNSTLEKLIKKLHSRYQIEISDRDNDLRRKLESKHQEYNILLKEKGTLVFIPRFFSKLKFERASISYNKQERLKNLFFRYQEEFNELASPYRYWYFVDQPPEFSLKQGYQVESMDSQVTHDNYPETQLEAQVDLV